MDDTFGLCGFISTIAAAVSLDKKKHGYLQINPFEYKRLFDEKKDTWKKFQSSYPMLETDEKLYSIKSLKQFNQIIHSLKNNQACGISLLPYYPQYRCRFTHWLAVKAIDDNLSQLIGDLSPFGIKKISLVIKSADLINLMKHVLKIQIPKKYAYQFPLSDNFNGIGFKYNLWIKTFN
jgi:hypothetical protein